MVSKRRFQLEKKWWTIEVKNIMEIMIDVIM